ncbi:bifunctional UDP-sugar hydrolase/5'-nucleotidase [uncultured Oscillibacter sp.]|uniref:bifunctional metallophosphatase/5'-nucleotidase n=1 Tax=uncultured Oscillibacter sp. TaxID=876091 RepID=UPI00262BC455|nr:5'-nucleotidase C-terminal domain-containing protein [uncultured Oscillibacter sp.]
MEEKTLQIYFTSDLHAFIYPTDYRSAEERELGLFKCANRFQKDGNTLIIDGGDVLQGSPLGAFCHDSQEDAGSFAQIMNCCGYDYVTLGNHDFNYGMAYLDSYLDALEARCVCQNALRSDGTVRFPSRVHVLENGLRVGVVGIVTDHVNVWERPEHLTGLTITDPIPAARAALEALRGQADLTVCVYHGGFERDLATGRILSASSENIAYRLCQELDFDILLTGHQHMCIPGQSLFGTFAVQAPDSGRAFISLKALVADGHIVCNSQAIPAGGDCDPILLDRFGNLEQGAQTWLDTVVGRLDRPLLPAPPLIMAAEGSDIADFFNEVQMSCSGAQLAATSLANEIAGFPQTVRRRDVLTAYPYTNTLTVLRVTGSVLRRAMERSAEYFAVDEEGRLCVADAFLKPKVEHYNYDYFSGVNYAFDISRPEGQRVVELTYQGETVKDEDEFTICLNSYRASGAGGYPEYTQCQVVREINIEMSDLILDFFKNTPKVSLKTHRWFSVYTSPGIGAL